MWQDSGLAGKGRGVYAPSMPIAQLNEIVTTLEQRLGFVTTDDIKKLIKSFPPSDSHQPRDKLKQLLVLYRLAQCGSYMALDPLVGALRNLGLGGARNDSPLICVKPASTPYALQYLHNRSLLPSYRNIPPTTEKDKSHQRIADSQLISPEEAIKLLSHNHKAFPILILDDAVLEAVDAKDSAVIALLRDPRVKLVLPLGWNYMFSGDTFERMRSGEIQAVTTKLIKKIDELEPHEARAGSLDSIHRAMIDLDPVIQGLFSKLKQYRLNLENRVFPIYPVVDSSNDIGSWIDRRGKIKNAFKVELMERVAHACNSGQPRPEIGDVSTLLQQIPDEYREVSLRVLRDLPEVFSMRSVAKMLGPLVQRIEGLANPVFVVSDSDESSRLIGYIAERVSGKRLPVLQAKDPKLQQYSTLVFVDDFVGSGGRIKSMFQIAESNSGGTRPNICIMAISMTSFAVKEMTRAGIHVFPGVVANTYAERSLYISPPHPISREDVRTVVGRTFRGTKQMGTSVAFPWGVPNNNCLIMGVIGPWFTFNHTLTNRPGGATGSYQAYIGGILGRTTPFVETQEGEGPVYIKYRDPAVAFISNLALTPFQIDGVEFSSVEAFIQYIKYQPTKSNETLREKIRLSFGTLARGLGHQANQRISELKRKGGFPHVYWQGRKIDHGSKDHHDLISRAIEIKFRSNGAARGQLLATGDRELAHSMPSGKHTSVTSLPPDVFVDILTTIRASLLRPQLEE